MLSEQEIKNILSKEPKKLRNSITNEIINSYNYTLQEQLGLIRRYIFDKKGVDVGDIIPPSGELCPSFVNLAVSKGINPMVVMSKPTDIDAANFAFDVALRYYYLKYFHND